MTAPAALHGMLRAALIALIPLCCGAFATIAWQNSHTLTAHGRDLENLRLDYERTKTTLLPGQAISLRFEANERELAHLRELVEDRLGCPAPRLDALPPPR